MEKDVFYSPSAICDDTIRGASPPGWYYLLKIVVRSVLTLVLCFIACMPVKAAESRSVSSGDVVAASDTVEEREGFKSFVGPDGTVVYVPDVAVNYIVFRNTAGNYYSIVSEKPIYICNTSYSDKTLSGSNPVGKIKYDVYDLNGSLVTYKITSSSTGSLCSCERYTASFGALREYFGHIDVIFGGTYQFCDSNHGSGDTGDDSGGTGDDSGDIGDDLGDIGDGSDDTDDESDILVGGFQYPIYETYEEFMNSPLYVTRYENEVLNRLEFIQYALAIQIALLFLLIFKRK